MQDTRLYAFQVLAADLIRALDLLNQAAVDGTTPQNEVVKLRKCANELIKKLDEYNKEKTA